MDKFLEFLKTDKEAQRLFRQMMSWRGRRGIFVECKCLMNQKVEEFADYCSKLGYEFEQYT